MKGLINAYDCHVFGDNRHIELCLYEVTLTTVDRMGDIGEFYFIYFIFHLKARKI